MQSAKIVAELLAECGITVDGDRMFDVRVSNPRFFQRVLRDGALGLGESYVEGWWECDRLDLFFERLVAADLERRVRDSALFRFLSFLRRWWLAPNIFAAAEVARRHYNLDRDIFESMLDSRMIYSCGYFDGDCDLERAQERKLDLICNKLQLSANSKLLDIGCGWGGLSAHAAKQFGVEVTAACNAVEQLHYAQERYADLPIKWELADYRQIQGSFDRIVSVGMFEHVGVRNYRLFFKAIERLLHKDGIVVLHTIGKNGSSFGENRWIARYIFPNSHIPSMAEIATGFENLFVLEDCHNIGPHYDTTLMAWQKNFASQRGRFASRYGDEFCRLWNYYLLSCAGAFRARSLQVWQMVLTRPGRLQPLCRFV